MVATVTGNLVAVTGSVRAGVELQFEPRSLPLAEEGSLVVSPSASVTTDANGDFTAALVAGDYRLVVGDDEATLSLTVPTGGGTYDILELVDAVPFVGESPTATPLATSTRSGKVKTDRDEADPVVATKAYVDEEVAGIDLSSRVAKKWSRQLRAQHFFLRQTSRPHGADRAHHTFTTASPIFGALIRQVSVLSTVGEKTRGLGSKHPTFNVSVS